jgi:hypothetical protein
MNNARAYSVFESKKQSFFEGALNFYYLFIITKPELNSKDPLQFDSLLDQCEQKLGSFSFSNFINLIKSLFESSNVEFNAIIQKLINSIVYLFFSFLIDLFLVSSIDRLK